MVARDPARHPVLAQHQRTAEIPAVKLTVALRIHVPQRSRHPVRQQGQFMAGPFGRLKRYHAKELAAHCSRRQTIEDVGEYCFRLQAHKAFGGYKGAHLRPRYSQCPQQRHLHSGRPGLFKCLSKLLTAIRPIAPRPADFRQPDSKNLAYIRRHKQWALRRAIHPHHVLIAGKCFRQIHDPIFLPVILGAACL